MLRVRVLSRAYSTPSIITLISVYGVVLHRRNVGGDQRITSACRYHENRRIELVTVPSSQSHCHRRGEGCQMQDVQVEVDHDHSPGKCPPSRDASRRNSYGRVRTVVFESGFPHGSSDGYVRGCSCACCRRAQIDTQKRSRTRVHTAKKTVNVSQTQAERHAAMLADLSDPRHGTTNGYGTYKCRCDRCTEANTIHCRSYRPDAVQRSMRRVKERTLTMSQILAERPKPKPSGLQWERGPVDETEARARAAAAL